MSVIEQAAKRLEELRRAGIRTADLAETARDPRYLDAPTTPRKRNADLLNLGHVNARHVVEPPPPVVRGTPNVDARRLDLDLKRLAAANIVTPDAPRSQLADEFRVIKRPLIENASRKGVGAPSNANLIVVTSALPGEGKSFTAANLAMSIAMEMDRTVLLVDADVARPSLPGLLGVPSGQGLLDLLLDDTLDVSDVLAKTNVETLSILSSGTPHARATELLASDAMRRLLEEMAQRYSDRIIIFDSPPLLVTTEARVLASHMGQVVLVVQAERTANADVMHALATIEACPIKLLMLNKGRAGRADAYKYEYGPYEHRT